MALLDPTQAAMALADATPVLTPSQVPAEPVSVAQPVDVPTTMARPVSVAQPVADPMASPVITPEPPVAPPVGTDVATDSEGANAGAAVGQSQGTETTEVTTSANTPTTSALIDQSNARAVESQAKSDDAAGLAEAALAGKASLQADSAVADRHGPNNSPGPDGIPDADQEEAEVSRIHSELNYEYAQLDAAAASDMQAVVSAQAEKQRQYELGLKQALDDYSNTVVNPAELWDATAFAGIGAIGAAFATTWYAMEGKNINLNTSWDRAVEANIAMQRSKLEAKSNKISAFEKLWTRAGQLAETDKERISIAKAMLKANANAASLARLAPYNSAEAIRDKQALRAKILGETADDYLKLAAVRDKTVRSNIEMAQMLTKQQLDQAKAKKLADAANAASASGKRAAGASAGYLEVRDTVAKTLGYDPTGKRKDRDGTKLLMYNVKTPSGDFVPVAVVDPSTVSGAAEQGKITTAVQQYNEKATLIDEFVGAWSRVESAFKLANKDGKLDIQQWLSNKANWKDPAVADLEAIMGKFTSDEIHALSGAAVSGQEAARLESFLVSSPFNKTGGLNLNTARAYAFQQRALNSSLGALMGSQDGRWIISERAPAGSEERRLWEATRGYRKTGFTPGNETLPGLNKSGLNAATTEERSKANDVKILKMKTRGEPHDVPVIKGPGFGNEFGGMLSTQVKPKSTDWTHYTLSGAADTYWKARSKAPEDRNAEEKLVLEQAADGSLAAEAMNGVTAMADKLKSARSKPNLRQDGNVGSPAFHGWAGTIEAYTAAVRKAEGVASVRYHTLNYARQIAERAGQKAVEVGWGAASVNKLIDEANEAVNTALKSTFKGVK